MPPSTQAKSKAMRIVGGRHRGRKLFGPEGENDALRPTSDRARESLFNILEHGRFSRDGTSLAINVKLPGPPEDGPYPTVIEYSGYSPADLDRVAGMCRAWASGEAPDGLRYAGNPADSRRQGGEVFAFMINGAKERAPAAALALAKRIKG